MIGLNEIGKSLMNTETLRKTSDLKLQADKVFAGYENSENIDISKPVFTKNEDAYKTINNNIPKNFEKQKIESVKMNSQFELKNSSDLDFAKKSSIENSEKNQYTDTSKEVKNSHLGLTEDEKRELKEETGWSDEIIDSIGSKEEAEIYKKAGLKEAEINSKKCLIREAIDMNQKDELGRTNKERMENGQPPITKNGETVELHHIGQKADSPLAELTTQEHRGKGNDTILHDKQKESEIDRIAFSKERENHWEARAEESNK
ncbi:HNH/ENDO VII family nuclease [Treponema denticola]|uniref:HNH/ENDO VII family nuclease n=1 Tax=Treponema denticola TaxID=158 RepID=UPI0020A3802F|nr:HNH/ENDO VII family nuclease [Treponema denticola]